MRPVGVGWGKGVHTLEHKALRVAGAGGVGGVVQIELVAVFVLDDQAGGIVCVIFKSGGIPLLDTVLVFIEELYEFFQRRSGGHLKFPASRCIQPAELKRGIRCGQHVLGRERDFTRRGVEHGLQTGGGLRVELVHQLVHGKVGAHVDGIRLALIIVGKGLRVAGGVNVTEVPRELAPAQGFAVGAGGQVDHALALGVLHLNDVIGTFQFQAGRHSAVLLVERVDELGGRHAVGDGQRVLFAAVFIGIILIAAAVVDDHVAAREQGRAVEAVQVGFDVQGGAASGILALKLENIARSAFDQRGAHAGVIGVFVDLIDEIFQRGVVGDGEFAAHALVGVGKGFFTVGGELGLFGVERFFVAEYRGGGQLLDIDGVHALVDVGIGFGRGHRVFGAVHRARQHLVHGRKTLKRGLGFRHAGLDFFKSVDAGHPLGPPHFHARFGNGFDFLQFVDHGREVYARAQPLNGNAA